MDRILLRPQRYKSKRNNSKEEGFHYIFNLNNIIRKIILRGYQVKVAAWTWSTWQPFIVLSPDKGAEEAEKLNSLLVKIGGVVSEMSPENIVMIARAGSYMYNLATPQSDIDYIIIYKEPTEVIPNNLYSDVC